jgi:hypothetical protein
MEDFHEQENVIKQFLLGKLTEQKAEEIENRVFAEPGFAEHVQIVEEELITEHSAQRMKEEDRVLFEAKYLGNRANQFALESEQVFRQFLSAKSAGDVLLDDSKPIEPLPTATPISKVPDSRKTGRESGESWWSSVFKIQRGWAYAVLIAGLLLSIVVVWLLFRQSGNNPTEAQRQVIEVELARLNAAGPAPRESVVSSVALQPSERYGGAMVRIEASRAPGDALIEFRLTLAQAANQKYRATFLDDRRNELFSIPNLTVENSLTGPDIRILVPARHLSPGDYQINLSSSNNSGGNFVINSYSFRVVESK